MTLLRVTGLLSFVVGAVIICLSVYGTVQATEFAQNLANWQDSQGLVLDPAHFRSHWLLSMLVVGSAGTGCVAGGVALMRRNRWGLLAICASATLLATFPWFLKALGATRYAFEVGEVLETVVLGAIAAASAAAYWRRTDRVAV